MQGVPSHHACHQLRTMAVMACIIQHSGRSRHHVVERDLLALEDDPIARKWQSSLWQFRTATQSAYEQLGPCLPAGHAEREFPIDGFCMLVKMIPTACAYQHRLL